MNITEELKILHEEVEAGKNIACLSLESEWCNECPYFSDDNEECVHKPIIRHVECLIISIDSHRYDKAEEKRIIEELKKIYEEVESVKNIGCHSTDGCIECIDYVFDTCSYDCTKRHLIDIIDSFKANNGEEE